MEQNNALITRNKPAPFLPKVTYAFFPQHFLYLRPLPQMQGSLRPIFGIALTLGILGGQQLVSLQLDSLLSDKSSDNTLLFSLIVS
jgi:hypothetical protein